MFVAVTSMTKNNSKRFPEEDLRGGWAATIHSFNLVIIAFLFCLTYHRPLPVHKQVLFFEFIVNKSWNIFASTNVCHRLHSDFHAHKPQHAVVISTRLGRDYQTNLTP